MGRNAASDAMSGCGQRESPQRQRGVRFDNNLAPAMALPSTVRWTTQRLALRSQCTPVFTRTDLNTPLTTSTAVRRSESECLQVGLVHVEEPVRLILIDTPETNDPNTPPECYGQEATDYLTWLLSLGGALSLETESRIYAETLTGSSGNDDQYLCEPARPAESRTLHDRGCSSSRPETIPASVPRAFHASG
jgi:hypothetical protein